MGFISRKRRNERGVSGESKIFVKQGFLIETIGSPVFQNQAGIADSA